MPPGRKSSAKVPSSHQTIKTHTKFVLDVRYAPNGDHFASVGSDGKIFLYDGKLGESLGEFSESHTGTAVSQAKSSLSMTKKFSRVLAGHSTR